MTLSRVESIQKYYTETGKIMKPDVKWMFEELLRLQRVEKCLLKYAESHVISKIYREARSTPPE